LGTMHKHDVCKTQFRFQKFPFVAKFERSIAQPFAAEKFSAIHHNRKVNEFLTQISFFAKNLFGFFND